MVHIAKNDKNLASPVMTNCNARVVIRLLSNLLECKHNRVRYASSLILLQIRVILPMLYITMTND